MPPNLDRLRSRPIPEFQSLDSCYEQVYPLPTGDAFKTVNGAVFYVLSRWDTAAPVERDEVDGGVVYYLPLHNWLMQLFVLHLTDNVAALRFHACLPLDDMMVTGRAYVWVPKNPNEAFVHGAQAILTSIRHYIITSLRYVVNFEPDTLPPMPSKDDIYAVCDWHRIYKPEMTLKELAEQAGVSYTHIRNTRHEVGFGRIVLRPLAPQSSERPKRGRQHRSVSLKAIVPAPTDKKPLAPGDTGTDGSEGQS